MTDDEEQGDDRRPAPPVDFGDITYHVRYEFFAPPRYTGAAKVVVRAVRLLGRFGDFLVDRADSLEGRCRRRWAQPPAPWWRR